MPLADGTLTRLNERTLSISKALERRAQRIGEAVMDRVKHLIGNLAGPFAIWWTSGAAGIAIVRLARPDNHLSGAAVYIGAVLAGVAALYVDKARENTKTRAKLD